MQLRSQHTIKEESLGAGKQRESESKGLKSISDEFCASLGHQVVIYYTCLSSVSGAHDS